MPGNFLDRETRFAQPHHFVAIEDTTRTRSGFTPALREQLHKRFEGLEASECPFANLPEERAGRWGDGLTATKMKNCRWLKPALAGQFEFVEWTRHKRLRHSQFVALR